MEDFQDLRLDLKNRVAALLTHSFDDDLADSLTYSEQLEKLLMQPAGEKAKPRRRLVFDSLRIHDFDKFLWDRLLDDPITTIPAFEDAVADFAKDADQFSDEAQKAIQENDELRVGFRGEFGGHLVSPRTLSASRMNGLVCVAGIVTKATAVRPKVVHSVHYCAATKKYTEREYRDVTSNTGVPTGASYPTRDENGHLLEAEYGLCKYCDHQVITIQELPELSPPGLLPRSIDVILEDDLADMCKPGDRVYVCGIFKAVTPRSTQFSGFFRSVVVGYNVEHINTEFETEFSSDDISMIKQVAESSDPLGWIAKSLAPTIYGHDNVKKGLVLQLFGGNEKNLSNKTHLRGDINCLLVGDPGVAKSQLLRAVMGVSPLAVSTTGRGSTGVGLTAAVTTEQDTGEKRLEAGAMVLADRGVVCIDEFDKMNDQDRVAIHEVMEQQTVTIAKAGIHLSLNARCSVLAAANPLHGTYDHSMSITRNVNLPDSLLSRFDMVFIVLDNMDSDKDRQMANFVLKLHREATGQHGTSAGLQQDIHSWHMGHALDDEPGKIFMTNTGATWGGSEEDQEHPLTAQFLKKYIKYAKKQCSQIGLSEGACEAIKEYYVELRNSSRERALPVTARTLETIIRLSTAHAKLCLRDAVLEEDVQRAQELMDVVLKFEDQTSQNRVARPRTPGQDGESDIMDYESDEEPTAPSQSQRRGAGSQGTRRAGVRNPPSVQADATMEVDEGFTSLSEDKQRAVVEAIRALTERGPIHPLTAIQQELDARGVAISEDSLKEFVLYISANCDNVRLYLPKILFDEDTNQIYDVA
ncbi:unnamed protein product [Ostreobium quekettii]|uniref:DNA replication licensing factor MCM3 n=1 Tax=Ostreobium quekettii TaxID=121088 RepID=A0A8S1IPU7_9CHLO|nr:unnamed protein product [Ostreobium quekettii]|eukprot:evm.model.scf_162EXC.7 EVM.evm.TU.scf_162EXC.7   scf_162EXC:45401-51654(+)